MENTVILSKYEIVIIVDANLSNDEKEKVYAEAAEAIKKIGGKVINSQVWLEKQKFTFPIKKIMEGTYSVINFEIEGMKANDIKPILKLNEKILRFAIGSIEQA